MSSPLELEGRGGRGGLLDAAMPGAYPSRIVAAPMNLETGPSWRPCWNGWLLPDRTATRSGAAASRRHALRSRQCHLQALPHPSGDIHRFRNPSATRIRAIRGLPGSMPPGRAT